MGHEHNTFQPKGHEITEKDVKFYLSIFVVLSFLTLGQVLIFQSGGLSVITNATVQSLIALVKVFLVAYFFMHLKEESKWLKFIAAIPVFAVLYTVFIAVETIIR